jgi:hypothetical protein
VCQYNVGCGGGCLGYISLTLIQPVIHEMMRLLGFIMAAQ